ASMPDLVGRDFTATAPGQKFVGDITYIHTWAGFIYLATVIDCYSKKVGLVDSRPSTTATRGIVKFCGLRVYAAWCSPPGWLGFCGFSSTAYPLTNWSPARTRATRWRPWGSLPLA